MLDRDGYPEDDALDKIRLWDVKGEQDCKALLDFVETLWCYPTYFEENDGVYEISTGGWSGNESLIEAMYDNTMFQLLCSAASRHGGHFVFMLPSVRNKMTIEFKIEREG